MAAACGDSADTTTTTTTVVTGLSAPTTTTLTTALTADVPVGFTLHDGDGFSMLLPEDWTMVTPDNASALLEVALEGTLFSDMEDQILGGFAQAGVLWVFDFLGASADFADNINILKLPPLAIRGSELEQQALQDFELVGIVVIESEIRDVPAGEALVVRIREPALGNEGISYTILTDEQQWVITLSAADVDPLQSDFSMMIESFREVRTTTPTSP